MNHQRNRKQTNKDMNYEVREIVELIEINCEFDIKQAIESGLYEEYETFFQLSDKNSMYHLTFFRDSKQRPFREPDYKFDLVIRDRNGRKEDLSAHLTNNEMDDLICKLEHVGVEFDWQAWGVEEDDEIEDPFH